MAITEVADGYFACFIFKPIISCHIEKVKFSKTYFVLLTVFFVRKKYYKKYPPCISQMSFVPTFDGKYICCCDICDHYSLG